MTRNGNMHLLLGLGKPDSKPTPTVKKQRSNKGNFHFTKPLKAILGIVLVAVILGSVFVFYHPQPATNPPDGNDDTPISSIDPTDNPTSNSTQSPQNTINPVPPDPTKPPRHPEDTSYMIVTNSNGHLTATDWKKIAEYAWKYFEENTDSKTGLPSSTNDYAIFTDWDIGVYLQAIMDAQRVGVIGTEGDGGSYSRINKVLTFLETRPLNITTGYPFWFYGTDGQRSDENTAATVDIADTGRLFVALNNIKNYNSTLYQTRVDNYVYNLNHNRSDYVSLVPSIKAEGLTSRNMYTYYVFNGFASFWPNELSNIPNIVLDNILSSDSITYGNITLPKSRLTTESAFSALFELPNPSPKLSTITEKVYEAHETYYNITGNYRAFSEGPSVDSAWVYEWVVDYNRTWVVRVGDKDSDMSPMIFTKSAFSFLAAYNQTYSYALTCYLERSLGRPDVAGYYSAISESGSALDTCSLHTNGMIITAARYAIQHL